VRLLAHLPLDKRHSLFKRRHDMPPSG
jgi:hypothetical protein